MDFRLSGPLVGGPDLAGKRVAWAETRDRGRRPPVGLVRLARPGARTATAFRTSDRSLLLFDASPRALAFNWATSEGAGRSGTRFDPDLRGGQLGGPFTALPACNEPVFSEGQGPETDSDLDGSLLRTAEGPHCPAAPGPIVLRDLSKGGATRVETAQRVVRDPVAIAGRYVAFLESQADNFGISG